MFCKWDCGCIGLDPSAKPQQAPEAFKGDGIVILPCDQDRDAPRDSLTWFRRDMTDKQLVALDWETAKTLDGRIAQRFGKADRFDHLRLMLGIPEET